MASVTYNYNGSNQLQAVCAGLAPSTTYYLVCDDPDSTGDNATSDATGAVTLTITDIGGLSSGNTILSYIGEGDDTPTKPVATKIFTYGTSGEGGDTVATTWSYDGDHTVVATFTGVGGDDYHLKDQHLNTSSSGPSPLTLADTAMSGDVYCLFYLIDDTAPGGFAVASRIFAFGAAGPGFDVDPVSNTPEGFFSVALDDGPLAESPTWTRVDNQEGIEIEQITISRGRGDERSKTEAGTVTITGKDRNGLLDPTNPASAFYGKLVPVKQAAVCLYNPADDTWYYLFRGYIDTITLTLGQREEWLEFEITLTDMLDMLGDAEVVPDQAGNAVPGESVGDCYYEGAHVDDRILAVLADASTALMGQVWPASLLQIASGNVFVQGRAYSRGTTLLEIIDEACDAEAPGSTNRFITATGAFAFRGRFYRYNPSNYIPADNRTRVPGTEMLHWFIGDLAAYQAADHTAVYTDFEFALSKTNLINMSMVTPQGITDKQLASGDQFKHDATSISDYGPRTSGMSLENLQTGDADDGNTDLQETASFADATVQNYKTPVPYASEVTFKNPPAGDATLEANIWWLLCNIELSDLVNVSSTHPGEGGFNDLGNGGSSQGHYVEKIDYTLTPLQGDVMEVELKVGLSSRQHFSYQPASWTPS